jgi:D-threo-aldose 1-dehydrogenase
MRTAVLPGTDVETTVLGLGCADLFRLPGSRERSRVVQEAFERGIRHFDTAPMYGLGRAEPELGRFLRGRRDQVVVATKFGIRPTPVCRAIGVVQGPVRRVLAAVPALQDRARRDAAGPSSGPAGSLLYTSPGFDAAAAEQSLNASLRALRTDHVDLFLLHDPPPGSVRADEVRAFCEKALADGRIRAWGIAGEPGPTREVVRAFGDPAPLLQLRSEARQESAQGTAAGDAPAVTFGVIGGALHAIARHVAGAAERRRRWNAVVGEDCGDPAVLVSLLLRSALRVNPRGVVLVGTTKPRHVRDLVAAADRDPSAADPALDAFRALLGEMGRDTAGARSLT